MPPPKGQRRCLRGSLQRPAIRPRCDGPSTGPQGPPPRCPRRRHPSPLGGRLRPRLRRAVRDPPCRPRPRPWLGAFQAFRGETARPAAESSRWAPVCSCTGRRPRQTLFHCPPAAAAAAAATFWIGGIARVEKSRRPAVRRGMDGGGCGEESEREAEGEAKRRGRCPKCDANARSARNKRHRPPG